MPSSPSSRSPGRSATSVRILRELCVRGPSLARDLRLAVGVSTASFTRAMAELRGDVLAAGATRSLTYAARRPSPAGMAPSIASIPVYELSPSGPRHLGTLHAVEPRGFYFASSTVPAVQGFYPDLPWFFHDLRPAGFLGRLAPRQHPELGLPPDILSWSADVVLRWLTVWGVDTVGSFVFGDLAFGRVREAEFYSLVPSGERPDRYPALALGALGLGVPGSSAAGEQPKFLAVRQDGEVHTPVLVKFSPPTSSEDTGPARRAADLLRCEHHAATALRAAGIPAAVTAIIEAGGRVFLEVQRFDRVPGPTPVARLGLVSLLAAAAQHGANLESWVSAADDLLGAGVITQADHERVYLLDRLGSLIGNTDRHAGNLSFAFKDGALDGVSPAYDMLPMRYAVRGSEFSTPPLRPPVPTPRYVHAWRQAWGAAVEVWAKVAADEAIHAELRGVARLNGAALEAQRGDLDRLPDDPAAAPNTTERPRPVRNLRVPG